MTLASSKLWRHVETGLCRHSDNVDSLPVQENIARSIGWVLAPDPKSLQHLGACAPVDTEQHIINNILVCLLL